MLTSFMKEYQEKQRHFNYRYRREVKTKIIKPKGSERISQIDFQRSKSTKKKYFS